LKEQRRQRTPVYIQQIVSLTRQTDFSTEEPLSTTSKLNALPSASLTGFPDAPLPRAHQLIGHLQNARHPGHGSCECRHILRPHTWFTARQHLHLHCIAIAMWTCGFTRSAQSLCTTTNTPSKPQKPTTRNRMSVSNHDGATRFRVRDSPSGTCACCF